MTMESGRRLRVLIASPLEKEQVARIADFAPERVEVLFAPELLPEPCYPADHDGRPRELTAAEQARWQALLAAADILFDFDWLAPAELPRGRRGCAGCRAPAPGSASGCGATACRARRSR